VIYCTPRLEIAQLQPVNHPLAFDKLQVAVGVGARCVPSSARSSALPRFSCTRIINQSKSIHR
jgi:hypothetical protein